MDSDSDDLEVIAEVKKCPTVRVNDSSSDESDIVSDTESLPSIPPPSPPPHSVSPPKRRQETQAPSSSAGSRKMDPVSLEVDDIFLDLQFGSLSEFLAAKEKESKSPRGNKKDLTKCTASSSASVSTSGSMPIPELDESYWNSPAKLTTLGSDSSQGKPSQDGAPSKEKNKPKLKLPSTGSLKVGSYAPGSYSLEDSPTFKEGWKDDEAEREPTSYRVDPKQFRKAKATDPSKPSRSKTNKKKTGKENSQQSSSSGTSGSQFSVGTNEDNSQNPPSSMASTSSSSSTKDAVKRKAGDNRVVIKIHEGVCPDDLAARLLEKEIEFEIMESAPVEGLILFDHRVTINALDKIGQCSTKIVTETNENAMIVFPIENHLELIQNEIDVINNDSNFSSSSDSVSLTEWIETTKKKLTGKTLTLLIQGHDCYIRKVRKKMDKEYRDRVLNANEEENGNGKKKRAARSKMSIQLTKTEIQSALIHVQLHSAINYRMYEKPAELCEMLYHYSKSILEAPAKLAKLNQPGFDWYAVSDSVGGIPVEENGEGMKSLWISQLSQFPGVGRDLALAIARVYKNPKSLFKAYRSCSSVEEGKNLLTDIPVTIGVGPLKKTRRLGPEASKKIYRFFTSTDGEKEISI